MTQEIAEKIKCNLSDRFHQFSLGIVELAQSLSNEFAANEIGKQWVLAGATVSSNYKNLQGRLSINGMTVRAIKESNVWLSGLKDSNLYKRSEVDSLLMESRELEKILESGEIRVGPH